MTIKHLKTIVRRAGNGVAGRNHLLLTLPLFCGLFLFASAAEAQTTTMTWDANGGSGPNDGSGNWVGPNMWWNVSGGTNYTWGGTGTELPVVFGSGSGTAGVYIVTNNASVSQPLNVTFASPGSYMLVTDGTDVGQLSIITNGGSTSAYSPGIYVANNVSAVINVPWRQVAASDMVVETNAVLTFAQGTVGTLGQITFKGAGPAYATINATNGTWGGNNTENTGSGTTTAAGVTFNITGSAIVNFGTRFDIARSITGSPSANAVVNVGGAGANVQLNAPCASGNNSGNNLQVSRGGAVGTLNILSGGAVSTVSYLNSGAIVSGNLRITPDANNGQGTLNMSGGSLNLGIGPGGTPGAPNSALTLITLFDQISPVATGSAIFNMSGGTVSAKGITIGESAPFTGNATNQINITGGTVYLDAANISILTSTGSAGTNYACNLSGGTIGATANWSPACSVPINLTNVNGNITFQTAEANGTAHNISLSGTLTGVGGLNETGSGVLTLSGTNTYSGATVVSNGTLVISTLHSPANGPVTADGSAGTPIVSTLVANVGQHWSIGNLTYANGSSTADFNYGNFTPSTTVAAIQSSGNINFGITPAVTVEGAAIPTGTYPLITYTGTLSGTVPTAVTITLSGGSVSGYVTNFTATKTIALVVTASTYNPALSWGVGNGNWDLSSPNWNQFGSAAIYANGEAVLFDDTASGTSPITVTLNTTVTPASVTANGSAKNYIITGSGAIAGTAALVKDGTGVLTLTGANTYSGGTTVNAGQLDLNYGGNSPANSAIGTGPLTINVGATIDNTSGQAVTLLPANTQNWIDDFTFVGSTNLNLGTGPVSLGSGNIALTVNSNTLESDGVITDNGHGYGLTKTGSGTLVLSNANNFIGGLTLVAGTLDLNANGADGAGLFTMNGGVFDNTSGNSITLSSASYKWQGSFAFNGSSSLDMGGGAITLGNTTITVNSNTLTSEGQINGANNTLTKGGAGTLTLGSGNSGNTAYGLVINAGTVNFNGTAPFEYTLPSNPVTVNTNSTLVLLNPNGYQFGPSATIVLNGGLVEWNGDNGQGDGGEFFQSITFDSGILQNSTGTALMTLSQGVSLVGTNCDINLTNNATMTVSGVISNTGSLSLTGNGILTLTSNNTYTGSTVISGGTLALSGSISNSAVINIRSGATLDVTERGDQTLTLNAGQSLAGKGTVNGSLIGLAGSTVAPGGALTTGTLTINNNATVSGNLLLNLNDTNTPTSSQLVANGGAITYGGALTVTNTGGALTVGETFQLFPSAVTTFTAINLPATDASGNGYTWVNHVAVDGSIQVQSVGPTINPLPGPIQFNVSGSTLSLSWPTNLGWILQEQTNSLSVGLGTNWVAVPGSSSVNSTNITVNPANGSMFFRLMKP